MSRGEQLARQYARQANRQRGTRVLPISRRDYGLLSTWICDQIRVKYDPGTAALHGDPCIEFAGKLRVTPVDSKPRRKVKK